MREKNYAISLIRFVGMVLILGCHTFEWIGFTLNQSRSLGILGNYCAVGVQVFLILSGYLYGSRKVCFDSVSRIQFILRNFKKILFKYYVYMLAVIFPVYYLRSPNLFSLGKVFRALTCSGVVGGGVHHLWYIPYILFCYLMTPFLYDLKNYLLREKEDLKKCFFSLILIMFFIEAVGISFQSYFVGAWINSYVLGFFLPDIREKMGIRMQTILVFIMIFISVGLNWIKLFVRYNLLPLFQSGLKYELCKYYINYSRVFFALAIFCVLLLVGERMLVKDNYTLLNLSDRYSYDIFIVHMIYIKGVLSVLDMTKYYLLNVLLMLFLSVISAVILNSACLLLRNLLKRNVWTHCNS